MFRFAGVSASARPLVTSGIALARPPAPVLVPTPAPVRLNHVSSVNCVAPSPGAGPKVTYWLDPFSCSAFVTPAAPAFPPLTSTTKATPRTNARATCLRGAAAVPTKLPPTSSVAAGPEVTTPSRSFQVLLGNAHVQPRRTLSVKTRSH